MKSNAPLLRETCGELSMRLTKRGKKKYLLRISQFDAAGFCWRTHDIPLCFGVVKAMEVARAYWELEKIKRGVS